MDRTGVTVGVAVAELAAARKWYERVFELGPPEYEPVPGVAEYDLGGCWLQLMRVPAPAPGEWVLRLGVADAAAERDRIASLGVAVGELIRVEGAVAYFEFTDPDGNQLSCYTEL
ncbi:VOC family protein [Amycolatopsis suaedae]|uniref:VOC family protein n=1 Tax=Amycolatopsis suaedae TaxID=2510978 RepID=A0A4Q7J6N6_9PSEU|nr:VOC family protein [Amycolatopsis suaedae]RZQ62432.1 VOC family protein [Amycolatopsis suaedae]